MNQHDVLSIMRGRHACKLFEEGRFIAEEERATLLEVIRLSPSSFGMEPWRVIVVRDQALKEKLRPACWNQAQITTCSDLVLFTVDTEAVRPFSSYVRGMFGRRKLSAEAEEGYNKRYESFHQNLVEDAKASLKGDLINPSMTNKLAERERYHWCAKQCYIAAGNLMSMAMALGIDSCPIEGFDKSEVEKIIEIDKSARKAVLMVALGYRVNAATPKLRLLPEEIVEVR